jgi:3,4-dihydroxy 2-butanone 4-phosphate synthase / GTP cyclohydrolase II
LGLPMMATNNQSAYETAFTVSIEARHGVTTGISAADRAHTSLVAIDPNATPRSIVTPGHVFPLRARDGGVLERVGQTEGSVDLARLAGLNPSGVICEIMNPDGEMARMPDLLAFGERHRIRVVTVADMIKHRMQTERVVVPEQDGQLEVDGLGTWNTRLYRSVGAPGLHMALWKGSLDAGPTSVRVQPAPPSWSFLGMGVSTAAATARASLEHIHREGRGALVLMHLKPSAAAVQRSFHRDMAGSTMDAVQLSADALRDLGTGCQILVDLGVTNLKLLTSSSRPIVGIEAYGLHISERLALSPG